MQSNRLAIVKHFPALVSRNQFDNLLFYCWFTSRTNDSHFTYSLLKEN